MSLRPRYSLLTLLVLTALVAGGVKLWYGPHRVVEQVSPKEENEFTFSRDWRGNKIIHGPYISRYFDDDGKPSLVNISYYRHGVQVCYPNDHQFAVCYGFTFSIELLFMLKPTIPDNQLNVQEQQVFDTMIDAERQRIRELNTSKKIIEGYWLVR